MHPTSRNFHRHTGTLGRWLLVLSAALCPACTPQANPQNEQGRRKMLALLMPERIEIVQPFTRVRSFDGDATPDGIELLLRAVNALDNPGIMIVGDVRAELYEYVPASAENKGRRVDVWNVDLSTAQQQRTYWNRLTQMYEFRLGLDVTQVRPGEKYVLHVSYTSPLGEHLTDEKILEYEQR